MPDSKTVFRSCNNSFGMETRSKSRIDSETLELMSKNWILWENFKLLQGAANKLDMLVVALFVLISEHLQLFAGHLLTY